MLQSVNLTFENVLKELSIWHVRNFISYQTEKFSKLIIVRKILLLCEECENSNTDIEELFKSRLWEI